MTNILLNCIVLLYHILRYSLPFLVFIYCIVLLLYSVFIFHCTFMIHHEIEVFYTHSSLLKSNHPSIHHLPLIQDRVMVAAG